MCAVHFQCIFSLNIFLAAVGLVYTTWKPQRLKAVDALESSSTGMGVTFLTISQEGNGFQSSQMP